MAQCGWFPSIGQAKGFCKELLTAEEYDSCQPLNRFDWMRLRSILDFAFDAGYGRVGNYPEDGAFIRDFSVSGRRLVAHFVDGRDIPFFWQKLFVHPEGKSATLTAMRAEVSKGSQSWLRKNPDCALCGDLAAQVDHIRPFADLALSWLAEGGMDWDDVRTKVLHKGGFHRRLFIDADLRKAWVSWHGNNATLRSLCVPCHTSREDMTIRQLLD